MSRWNMPRLGRTLSIALLVAAVSVGGVSAQIAPSVSVPGGTIGGLGGTGGTGSLGGTSLPGGIGGSGSDIGGLGGIINDSSRSTGTMITGSRIPRGVPSVTRVTTEDIYEALISRLNRLEVDVWVPEAPALTLVELRKLRLQQLVSANPSTVEMDAAGNPVVRGRLIAIDPSVADLKRARRAGFTVASNERDTALGIRTVILFVPRGMNAVNAMALLRRAAPRLSLDFDHVFEPAGGALAASSVALAGGMTSSAAGRPLIGMIDGGVGQHPALQTAAIEQRGFAGAAEASGHGTAVASLIVGSKGKFRGAAPEAFLLVGDVYGGNPAAGSASVIAKAMSWMAARRPSVVNVSLVGPRNRLVERAVAAVQARGMKVVAAVGNDGPAAPPVYPASLPGVLAVTGVDGANRALPEAGRSPHLDYAGPGADMAAALPGEGYANVRGTSFAAPFVSSRLALTGSTVRLDAEARKGHGRVGRGVVCADCRVPPRKVRAR